MRSAVRLPVLLSLVLFALPAAAQHTPPGGHVTAGAPEHAPDHAEGHGEHEHKLAPFNFADGQRYVQEKQAAARGEPIVPVVPYVYVLLNFAALAFIYYWFGRKPIGDALQARRDVVEKQLLEAKRIRAEAEAKLKEYEGRMANLDADLAKLRAEMKASAEAEQARIAAEAEQRAATLRRDADQLLEQELRQLRADLLRETVDLATAAAEQALRGKISSADHDRLADDLLRAVASSKQVGAPS